MWLVAAVAVILPTMAFAEISVAPDFPVGENTEKAKGNVSAELVAAYRADVQPTVAEQKPAPSQTIASTGN